MCLEQVKGYTNARFIGKNSCRSLFTSYPCGHCSECKSLKKSEWRLRAYYEAKRCFDERGFVVFDTLTYSDDNIPYIHDHCTEAKYTCWDYYAFNREHLQKFLKLLRVRLKRDGYDVDGKLRYFISSEFGLDPTKTERSHYHALFFVNFDIDPLVFSRYISRAWSYGKTDGISPGCDLCPVKKFCKGKCIYQSSYYVSLKRVFSSYDPLCLNVTGYVAKYVTKDVSFDTKVRSVLRNLMNSLTGSNKWMQTYSGRLMFRSLYSKCSAFHLESKGFGEYALKVNNLNDIVALNSLPMPVSNKKVVVSVPLPMYYRRKLFYDVMWFNGSRFWIPNELGRKYLLSLSDRNLLNYENRLKSIINNLDSCGYFINAPFVRSEITRLLAGRSIAQYASYIMRYRGRLKSPIFSYIENFSTDNFNYNQLCKNGDVIFSYNTSKDVFRFGHRFFSDSYLGDSKYFSDSLLMLYNRFRCLPSEYFCKAYCVFDSFSEDFKGFDELYDLFDFVMLLQSNSLEKVKKQNEKQYERYKKLGFFNRVI